MTNKTLRHIALLAACCSIFAISAKAQYLGTVSPNTDQETAFNGTTPSPGAVFKVKNLGQNVHFFSYSVTNPIQMLALDIRLLGSIDGTHFFPISEDATNLSSGAVYAVGFFPVVEIQIVDFQTSGSSTLTGSYVGTSATSGPPVGNYSAAQQFAKTLWNEASAGSTQLSTLTSPTGSSSGYVYLFAPNGGNLPAGSSLIISATNGTTNQTIASASSLSTVPPIWVAIPDFRSQQLSVSFGSGGASSTAISAYYFFSPPGVPTGLTSPNVQPLSVGATTLNSETVGGAANTPVVVTLSGISGTRISLFQVAARCGSTGQPSLFVQDSTSGNIFVSVINSTNGVATIFKWAPGLTALVGSTFTITLGSCGDGTNGAIDVQASRY